MGKGESLEVEGQSEEESVVAQSLPLSTCNANSPHPSSAEKLPSIQTGSREGVCP